MKKQTRTKQLAIGCTVIALMATVAVGFLVYYNADKQDSKSNALEEIVPPTEKNDKQQQDGTASSPPKPTSNSGSVTILGFTKDSSNYYFTLSLSGISKGSCNLNATQANKTATTQGKVELVTSYYTCSNMKIPITNLAKGEATITVIISSDGNTTNTASGVLTLD